MEDITEVNPIKERRKREREQQAQRRAEVLKQRRLEEKESLLGGVFVGDSCSDAESESEEEESELVGRTKLRKERAPEWPHRLLAASGLGEILTIDLRSGVNHISGLSPPVDMCQLTQ